ncbi:MAG: ExbD/TolR family protein [Candidatus Brocadiia bacterium]
MKLSSSHSIEAGKFSMAAMTDIAFLLIIFFMVCAKFVEKNDINVRLPESRTGQHATEVPITVTVNEKGLFFVKGVQIQRDQLLAELKGQLRAAKSADEKTIIVRAARSLDYGQIRPAVDAVDRAGGMLELAVLER